MTPEEAERIGFDFELRPREIGPVTRQVQEWLDDVKQRCLAEISAKTIEDARLCFLLNGVPLPTAATPAP